MSLPTYIVPFTVSLLIGALMGVEREKQKQSIKDLSPVGVRTSILISLLGTLSAFLGNIYHPAVFLIALGAIIALTVAGYMNLAKKGRIGMTTETSILLTFLYGGMCAIDQIQAAVILSIVTTLILSLKDSLHTTIRNINKKEMWSAIQFAIIAFIILPLLPDQSYDKEILGFLFPTAQTGLHESAAHGIEILNPYKIWLLVVIASGISFLGYILVKTTGSKMGIGVSGLMGGLYSSTTTSLTLAQRSKEKNKTPGPFVTGIILALGISFVKMFLFIRTLNAELFSRVLAPMGLMMIYLLGVGFFFMLKSKKSHAKKIDSKESFKTPFTLTQAVKVGSFIVAALFIAKLALSYAGVEWYYVIATLLSILAIDDPVVISTSAAAGGLIDWENAKNIILLVTFLNTVQKAGIVWFFGNRKMLPRLLKVFVGLFLVTLTGFLYL